MLVLAPPAETVSPAAMTEELEVPFACPYCSAPITMLVDPSVPAQVYVEDCEVCCHPIEVRYAVEDGELAAFSAEPMAQ